MKIFNIKQLSRRFIIVSVLTAAAVCVAAPAGRYNRYEPLDGSGEFVVQDGYTGLMWQGCVAARGGSLCDTTLAGTSKKDWKNALSYCESLTWGGYTDWRLPNVKELRSIVDLTVVNPAIDLTVFPGTPDEVFHSSTANPHSLSWSAGVQFSLATVLNISKSVQANVRCVRDVVLP